MVVVVDVVFVVVDFNVAVNKCMEPVICQLITFRFVRLLVFNHWFQCFHSQVILHLVFGWE